MDARQGIGTGRGARLLGLVGCLALTLSLSFAAAGGADAKKKGKKKKAAPKVFSASDAANVAIPDDPAAGASTPVVRTLTVPKGFKGKVVGDLDVTGLQTTGSGAGAANDLTVLLTAPSGKTSQLFQDKGDGSIGPLTIDDDTRTSVCDSPAPPCPDPDITLNRPFAGTANGLFLESGDTGPLSVFRNVPMPGTWKLTVFDESDAGTTSVLNAWGLRITAAVPPVGGKKGSSFTGTASPNAAIPDAPAAGASTAVRSTITAGKAFKGRVVGDLDVTGIATTGSAAGAADDLTLKLTAPNGRTVQLFSSKGDQSLGPWTLNDETQTSICDSAAPPCPDPLATLNRPFAGTSNVQTAGVGGIGPLSAFDGVPIKGSWTLSAVDLTTGATSTLNSWGLRITAAKPPKPTGGKGKKAGASAKKKGKKKTPKQFAQQLDVNLAVPQDAAAGASTPVTSTLNVPKKFKGLSVGDVDVTGIRVTGSAANAVNDLVFKLTAPDGKTARLFQDIGSDAIGPLTLDDDSPVSICDATTPPCEEPNRSLPRPFAGTANSLFLQTAGTGLLSSFEGSPMRGAWRLTVFDDSGAATTNTLNSWGLRITRANPIK